LEKCIELTNIIIAGNSIKEITHIDILYNLRSLDIENCKLQKISGLRSCTLLETINASKNELGNVNNIMELRFNTHIRSININTSQIAELQPEDPETLISLLKSLKELRTLYLYGNDIIKNIRNYRKLLTVEIKDIM